MLAAERRHRIMERLITQGNVIVSELSKQFKVTEETIRRDLERLEKEGLLVRTHGGAYLNQYTAKEYPVGLREIAFIEEKKLIAARSVELIQTGDSIMLDASTTSLFIARYLKQMQKHVTIITNSLKIEVELAEVNHIKLISTGGTLRSSSMSHVGYITTDNLSKYLADKAFVSCTAVNFNRGLMDSNEFEAEVRKKMLQHAEQKILVADHTKFGKNAFHMIDNFHLIDMIIVDKPLSQEWQDLFVSLNIAFHYAKHD